MINIDIAQQLFPNPLTMFTQLCATAILFYFVKKFLWASARDMMEKRSSAMQATLTDAEKHLNDAKESKKVADDEILMARSRSQDIISRAEAEAKELRDEIVLQAKKDADRTLEKARDEITLEKKQMRDEVVGEMISVAMSATEKLISEKVDQQTDQKSIERFVKEMSDQA